MTRKNGEIEYKLYLTYEEGRTGGDICKGEENEPWPSHDAEYITWKPEKLFVKPTSWCETIRMSFNPEEYINKTLYLVVVRYYTGDTFGTSHGHWKIIGLYKTKQEAYNIKEDINNGGDGGCDYKTWDGYFEGLEEIDVSDLILNDNS